MRISGAHCGNQPPGGHDVLSAKSTSALGRAVARHWPPVGTPRGWRGWVTLMWSSCALGSARLWPSTWVKSTRKPERSPIGTWWLRSHVEKPQLPALVVTDDTEGPVDGCLQAVEPGGLDYNRAPAPRRRYLSKIGRYHAALTASGNWLRTPLAACTTRSAVLRTIAGLPPAQCAT